jgi:hypothetical protein
VRRLGSSEWALDDSGEIMNDNILSSFATATLIAASSVVLLACNHDRVNAFRVSIPTQVETISVCKGDKVDVKWDVTGRASLGTARGGPEQHHEATDFTMHDVDSAGHEPFTVTESTAYRITALGANPGNDGSYADQYAVVPVGPILKGNTATCDGSNKCTASFTLEATPSMIVRWVGDPMITQSGSSKPFKICVSHEGSSPVCVDAGAVGNVNASAAGTWTLEADLPAGMPALPPPILKMHFDFGCP